MRLEFSSVYDDNVAAVYGFFAYRLNSRPDAEDLTQLTFERALRAWPRYDPRRAAPSTWLLAIARNLLIDHYRADRSSAASSVDDPSSGAAERLPPVTDRQPALGLAPELSDALSRLSQRDREILALRYGGDLTGPEIAAVTELSLANVQQILSRSLRRLREELDERQST